MCRGSLGSEWKKKESLEALEQAVTLDPRDYLSHLKLAESHVEAGNTDRAGDFFVSAARAQVKVGNAQASLASFKRAIELGSKSPDVLRSYLEACLSAGDVSEILPILNDAVAEDPESLDLLEMKGKAHLANKEYEEAKQAFNAVLSSDNSRYENLLLLCHALLELEDLDRASHCLDPIVPIVISRKETDKVTVSLEEILSQRPDHLPTLTKMADILSTTNDHDRQLEVLDRLAVYHLEHQNPSESLEYLLRILQIHPESEKHLDLHRRAHAEAYPGTPYEPPAKASTEKQERTGHEEEGEPEPKVSNSKLIEVDLLLNYDMRDKALSLLLAMETESPTDKEVRSRLLSFYKDLREDRKAAEQCLALAAIHRKSQNEEAAQRFLEESEKMCPELVQDPEFNLVHFAQERGIPLEESQPQMQSRRQETGPDMELDLSGDLTEIFFKDGGEPELSEETIAGRHESDEAVEEFVPAPVPKAPGDAISELMQEVDFYLRLGFHDEAKSKLAEAVNRFPDHPEILPRLEQLEQQSGSALDDVIALGPGESDGEPLDLGSTEDLLTRIESPLPMPRESEAQVEAEVARIVAGSEETDEAVEHAVSAQESTGNNNGDGKVNLMFADLIDEVNSISDNEINQEDYETHFSMGIAYREMDLLEDAINEFQGAIKTLNPSKSPREVVQCCGMLSTCFLEKGMPRFAIRWCQTGLRVPEVSAHEALALRYDMGIAHALNGESEQAEECFNFIYGVDPEYRDVAQRLHALKRRSV